MIALSNITLKFEHTLIKRGAITIPDNLITVITGKSGSGKTSLLYLIGLISSNTSYEYIFDGKPIDLKSDTKLSNVRKKQIGYVFQDNSLIESLSIADNIKHSAKIAGHTLSEDEVVDYLTQVHLDVDCSKYPRILSGGERQRLAIACAMAKNPALIVADEPTSALDRENSILIMDIFRSFANKRGKKVVVASHNQMVTEAADVVYEIAEEKIVLKRGEAIPTEKSIVEDGFEHVPFSFAHSIKYAVKTMKRSKFLKALMIVLCAISIALAACISGIGEGLVKHQESLLETISDKEVFLINFTAPLQTYVDVDENLSISAAEETAISKISSIDSIYPYLEFRSVGYDFIQDTFFDSCNVEVATDGRASTYTFNEANDHYKKIVVAPYYKEDNVEKRVINSFETDATEKIYFSYELANVLGLANSSLSDVQISLSIGVPMGTTDVNLNVSSSESSYMADIDVSKIAPISFELSGVLDHDFKNRRSASGNMIIYMPIDTMLRYMNSIKATIDPSLFHKDYGINEWRPSAYVSFVKNYNDIDFTVEKLEKINPNFKAVSAYQDIDSMNELLSNVRDTASWIIIAVLVIVLILMAIIYINSTVGRKYEFAILKANGLNNRETLKIALSEAFIQLFGITIFALIIALLISGIVNLLFSFNVLTLSIKTVAIIVSTALIAVLVPTIGSIIIMNHVKPDRILRN